jgi:SSS family solute:Na+ symporter
MDNISLLVVIGYLTGVSLIGVVLMRRTSGARDWAVAGGGMGLGMIAVGIAGTRIGGAGTYGVAGDVMTGGVWNMWWYGINTFLALAIVGVFFALPYRRLRLQTVGEVFMHRYRSRRCQVFTSLCVQTEYAIVNVIEIFVTAAILGGLTDLNSAQTIAIATAVIVIYTALGGLWGTAFTNLIHCAVIVFGLLLVGLMGVSKAGGWDSVVESVNGHLSTAQMDQAQWWSIAGAGWGAVLGMFFSASIHSPAASVYVNYATAARHEKDVVPGFVIAGIMAAVMPILAGLIGILTLAKYGANPGTRGYTNLTKLATDIDPIVGGIALAAVLAAVISSGGPILLSSATMFVRDWLPFTRDYTSEKKLLTYRIVSVIIGVLSAIVAWIISQPQYSVSILDLLLFGFAMVVPPAIAIGYVLYWRRTTEFSAFWGMFAGYVAGLIWFGLIKWAKAAEFTINEGDSFWRRAAHYFFVYKGEGIDPSFPTTFVPLVLIPILALRSAREQSNEAFYETVRGRRQLTQTPSEN